MPVLVLCKETLTGVGGDVLEGWNAVPAPLDPAAKWGGLCFGSSTDVRQAKPFHCSHSHSPALPTLKHWFVPDHRGWMLGRSLCSVPQANAINPCWCPCPVFLLSGSQTFTFVLKQLTLLVLLQSLSTCSLELGRVSVKDSGAFSVFLYVFSPLFSM